MSHALNINEKRDCAEGVHNSRSILPISRHIEGGSSNEEQQIDGRGEWITSGLNDATTTPNFTTTDMMVPKAFITK